MLFKLRKICVVILWNRPGAYASQGVGGSAPTSAAKGAVQLYLHYSSKWQDNFISTNSTSPDRSYAKTEFSDGWALGTPPAGAQGTALQTWYGILGPIFRCLNFFTSVCFNFPGVSLRVQISSKRWKFGNLETGVRTDLVGRNNVELAGTRSTARRTRTTPRSPHTDQARQSQIT